MSKLAEVRERVNFLSEDKEDSMTFEQTVDLLCFRAFEADKHRAFMLSLLDEIEALPDKYEKFIPDAHIGPLWGAGYASALEHVAKQIRAIIARGVE